MASDAGPATGLTAEVCVSSIGCRFSDAPVSDRLSFEIESFGNRGSQFFEVDGLDQKIRVPLDESMSKSFGVLKAGKKDQWRVGAETRKFREELVAAESGHDLPSCGDMRVDDEPTYIHRLLLKRRFSQD